MLAYVSCDFQSVVILFLCQRGERYIALIVHDKTRNPSNRKLCLYFLRQIPILRTGELFIVTASLPKRSLFNESRRLYSFVTYITCAFQCFTYSPKALTHRLLWYHNRFHLAVFCYHVQALSDNILSQYHIGIKKK